MTDEPTGSAQTEFPRSIGRVATRALAARGFTRYDQLTRVSAEALLEIHGVGPKAVAVLREELATRNLSFAGTRPH
jgi:hypothetical protein